MNSKFNTVVLVALGLTAKLFDGPHTLGDVRMLAQGRLHLWPEWASQPDQPRELVARFLGHRPDELGEDRPLLDRLRRVIGEANDFELDGEFDPLNAGWGSTYRMVPGAPLEVRLDEWLSQLDALRGQRSTLAEAKRGDVQELEFVADGVSYRIPLVHLPEEDSEPVEVMTCSNQGGVRLDFESLRELAQEIDRGAAPGVVPYETVAVDKFLNKFQATDGSRIEYLPAGRTQLAVAPTGTGKSVFARLMGLHLASRNLPVALVVPDIQSVWTEVLRIRRAAEAAKMEVRVVPLSSWRNLAGRLAEHVEHPPAEDPDGRWALENVGYTCLLSAYIQGDEELVPGQEPCTRLRQRSDDSGRDSKVACPFRDRCGRFSSFDAAVDADIIVVNHHAFLAGRVPIPVAVDGEPPRKLTTAELVFRRCAVVLIDEIDRFQDAAIGANSRGLALSSRGSLSKPNQLYNEVERRRAENRIDSSVRFERGRSALLRIMNEAERLSELINRSELDWPAGRRMTWREAYDAWIAERLYGEDDDAIPHVRALYDQLRIERDELSERLRLALAPLGPGLGDGTLMEEVRSKIMQVLLEWPLYLKRVNDRQAERNLLTDRLILRAVLVQLDRALGHLRPQLPGLEQLDIPQAARLRDDLLGYAPWQPSPAGPLGQRLYGYAFSERVGEQGALETRVMSGDPHALVRELGGLVAHAMAGVPRVVVGLSATCRFRGSPRADVLGDLLGSVRDEARNVQVHEAVVDARVSGIGSRAERLDAARDAAKELWQKTLTHYLRRKMQDKEDRGRARALLVTGSYAEAEAVAQGLRNAADKDLQIRYLVRSPGDAASDPDSMPRQMLETFGEVPAPAVLVGPLSVVSRGHNILQPGSRLSALSGIFVLTRPVPPSHDASSFLAHLAYNAGLFPPTWEGSPSETISAERRDAWRRLRALQRSPATFRYMDSELRRELVCDVLVELAQLAGRARRGGTSVDLVFVDNAFQDEVAPWSRLVAEVLEWWKEQGWFDEMAALHGALVNGLADYVGAESSSKET